MESDKPGPDDPPGPDVKVFKPRKTAGVMTVTELMDKIERTALERHFAAREYRRQSDWKKQTPSAS